MNLNQYMLRGMDGILTTARLFHASSKEERAFLGAMLLQIKKSALLREKNEKSGVHVPPFLIASIASQCNLHCAGCYARADGACREGGIKTDLSAQEWKRIFEEAGALGVSFILLAGGEPLLRRDVMDAAASCRNLIFPVFTNGTMLDEAYLALFDENRNLIPILSLEGEKTPTDARRGPGVYHRLQAVMEGLMEKKLLFGASVTVTHDNIDAVATYEFLAGLHGKGCGAVIFVEYVPVEKGTQSLVLSPEDLAVLRERAADLRARLKDMVILSFPGDEEQMGGCLASGRGFFHINSSGGAEPCPFSPYAKYNLTSASMGQVLKSEYFQRLRSIAARSGPHAGGCVLFEREEEVQALLGK